MTRCRAEVRTYHLLDDEQMLYVLSHSRGFVKKLCEPIMKIQVIELVLYYNKVYLWKVNSKLTTCLELFPVLVLKISKY